MSKHTVKLHKWRDGILTWSEHVFHSRKDAEEFAVDNDHHVAKIYNDQGNMINEVVKQQMPDNVIPTSAQGFTYA
jgi:hypothetical protein